MRGIGTGGLVCYKLLCRLDIWFCFNCFEIVTFGVYDSAAFDSEVLMAE